MSKKKTQWELRALFTLIALLLAALILPPVNKPKARASRIQTVNHVASVTITLPSTNGLSDTTK